MAVFFIFVDGVGLGNADDTNPFYKDSYTSIERLTRGNGMFAESKDIVAGELLFKGIDANLGVEGLPQSGTGQTALFTGINASKEIGKHFGPFPHTGIKPFLRERSIFHDTIKMGKKPHFMNAYPPIFFEKAEERNRWSCTTLMTRSSGVPLNQQEEIEAGTAITADIIQKGWRDFLNIDIPEISAATAADRMLTKGEEYDLVLFEYYLTDKAGHSQQHDQASRVLAVFDEFLNRIIEKKTSMDTLVITSDHGNVEDLSVKTHTRNKVPLFVLGPHVHHFEQVKSLIDIKSQILASIA